MIVSGMNRNLTPCIRADDKADRTVRIYMVLTALRVIFEDKDRRLSPEGAAADGFHKLSFNHPDYDRIKFIAAGLSRKYRVLNFDARAAAIWGELTAQATGPLPLRDSFIAAIRPLTRLPDRHQGLPRHSSAWAAKWLIPGNKFGH